MPLPRRPSVCLGPRFWAVLWHPFTTGPTVSTTCTSYSLIFGVSHTQGERQPRAHPALPESTPNPLYLPHTPSLNLSRPDTRQQRTVPKPAGIIGRGRSQAVRPALPCPCHTDPQPQASPACPPALVVGMEVRCNSGVLTSPQSQDQAPEPLPPALKSSLCPPSPPPQPPAGAARPQAPAGPAPTGPHLRPLLGPDADLAIAAFLRVQGAHEGPDGRTADHVHGDAALRQGPDDAHLRAASMPTGTGSQRPLCPPEPRTAILSCPPSAPTSCTRHGKWGKGGNSDRGSDAPERQPALSLLVGALGLAPGQAEACLPTSVGRPPHNQKHHLGEAETPGPQRE